MVLPGGLAVKALGGYDFWADDRESGFPTQEATKVSSLDVAGYLGSSTRKILLSAYHLRSFNSKLDRLAPQDFSVEAGPDDPFISLDADSDGCVLQSFAALDAFACAAAWHFGPGKDDAARHGFSFRLLAAPPPPSMSLVVGRLATSSRYKELRTQRHRAGHRGVTTETRNFRTDVGIRLKTIDGSDAQEVLTRLFRWTQHATRLLQGLACLQGWPGHEWAYLLNRWPVVLP
jgi:hypothetical protein